MRKSLALSLALSGTSLLCGAADAASYEFGGTITGRAGYGVNPNFNLDTSKAGGTYGGDLSATLARITSVGRTSLTGSADVIATSGNQGSTQNYTARLSHAQQFSPKLSVQGDVAYTDTTNPGAIYSTDSRDLVPIGDVLTLGTHSRQESGDINVGYQWDSKNLIQAGANAVHTTYANGRASPYTQYGGTLGYLRTINENTRIGLQLSATRVNSDVFSGSTSYTSGLVLTQRLGPRWTFQGGINGVLQKAFSGTYKTLGFNASLCGDYDRLSVCGLGSRASAASGIGGLRIDTQGGLRVNYKLTARSTVSAEATYDISSAHESGLPTQHYLDGGVTYRRTLTERLRAGFTGRYQHRSFAEYGAIPASRIKSYVGTADIVYRFGRLS